MIETVLLITLFTNGLIINPVYQYLLDKLKLNKKPFNCVYCLSFWLGCIYSMFNYNSIVVLIVPFAASFVASLMERFFESLPTKIN